MHLGSPVVPEEYIDVERMVEREPGKGERLAGRVGDPVVPVDRPRQALECRLRVVYGSTTTRSIPGIRSPISRRRGRMSIRLPA